MFEWHTPGPPSPYVQEVPFAWIGTGRCVMQDPNMYQYSARKAGAKRHWTRSKGLLPRASGRQGTDMVERGRALSRRNSRPHSSFGI